MTPEQVRAMAAEVQVRLDKANLDRQHALVDLRFVQARCDHPDKHQYSAMGELGWYCPDCKWQT